MRLAPGQIVALTVAATSAGDKTHTDPTGAALSAAILAHPEADLPRLVYADWLEENGNGQAERAEFIRVQCELAGGCDPWCRDGLVQESVLRPHGGVMAAVGQRYVPCPKCWPLRAREGQLLAEFGPRWYEEFGRSITGGTECAAWSVGGPQPSGWMVFGGGWAAQREPFIRGFVGRVAGTLAWLRGGERCGRRTCHGGRVMTNAHGSRKCPDCHGTGLTPGRLRELVAKWPLTVAIVTDREPMEGSGCHTWFNDEELRAGDESGLPPDLYRRLKGHTAIHRAGWKDYPTREAAVAALSDALIAEAKSDPTTASH